MTGTVETTTDDQTATVAVCSDAAAGAFVSEIDAAGHALVSDEPHDLGGTDAGPSPYDYLLASLGACTAMTVRMYADRKRMALRRVCVRLTHSRSHGRDCADCEDHDTRVERIRRCIELEGELDQDERTRLLEIATRCPVHRTLAGAVEIDTVEGK